MDTVSFNRNGERHDIHRSTKGKRFKGDKGWGRAMASPAPSAFLRTSRLQVLAIPRAKVGDVLILMGFVPASWQRRSLVANLGEGRTDEYNGDHEKQEPITEEHLCGRNVPTEESCKDCMFQHFPRERELLFSGSCSLHFNRRICIKVQVHRSKY